MKTFVGGREVEGTPEEISRFLKIVEPETNFNVIDKKSYPSLNDYAHSYNPCSNCPNFGKGPCHCTLPYMNWTGTGGYGYGNYSVTTTATYRTEAPESASVASTVS